MRHIVLPLILWAITLSGVVPTLKGDDATIHKQRGKALIAEHQVDPAIKEFRKALQLDSSDAETHHELASALQEKGELDHAVAEYRKALRLKPDYAEAHAYLGAAFLRKGDVEDAIAEIREALRLKPDFIKARVNLGSALRLKGDPEGAIEEFRNALREDPDLGVIHVSLAGALSEKGDLDGAIAECREAIRLDPDIAEWQNVLRSLLDSISNRGIHLANYDAAAWQATDAIRAAHADESRLGLYIARKTDAGWLVAFGRLNSFRDKFLTAYEAAQVSQKFEVKSFDPAREDKGWNLAAAKAIENAMRDFDLGRASRPYNIAVLPAEREGLYVYLYPAQMQEGICPLGGDVRYLISNDGEKIIEKRQLHKGIFESPYTASTDTTVKAGSHSHVLSQVPEETDVFLVLTRRPRVPEIVIADASIFTIDVNGRISMADRPK